MLSRPEFKIFENWQLANLECFETESDFETAAFDVVMERLPAEILEIIFSYLPSVVDQVNICLVCKFWRQVLLELRSFTRITRRLQCSTAERKVYVRLPIAASLSEGYGPKGFAVLVTLKKNHPIFFCGFSIFLPHPSLLDLNKTHIKLRTTLEIREHGTAYNGPQGTTIT